MMRQKRWMLWRVQKMAFWVLYDHAGPMILLNLLTLVAVILPASLLALWLPGWPWISAGAALLAASVALAGQANLMVALLSHEDFSLKLVARGIARHGLRAAVLATCYVAAGAVCAVGLWFYATRVTPVRPLAGFVLYGMCLAAGVMLLMSAAYLLPALVFQRGSIVRPVRTSALLMARHPVLTPGLCVLAGAYSAVLATPPGMVLLSTLPLVALSCCAYELLARQYAAENALERGEVPADLEASEALDENDLYLNRGFSDFLFPWKA